MMLPARLGGTLAKYGKVGVGVYASVWASVFSGFYGALQAELLNAGDALRALQDLVASPALAHASRGNQLGVPLLLVRYLHAGTAAEYRQRRDAFSGSRPGKCAFLDAAPDGVRQMPDRCRSGDGTVDHVGVLHTLA